MKSLKEAKFCLVVFASILFSLNSCQKTDEVTPVANVTGKSSAQFNPELTYGTLTDQDGNVYKTIKIGTQTWMAENLRAVHYRNGDPIPNVKGDAEWLKLTTGAYCTYKNSNDKDSIATFGRFYNWYVVGDSRKICPLGWHVPTQTEAQTLMTFLGGSEAGKKLKESGAGHWANNTGGSNSSGFTGLPTGLRSGEDASYFNLGGLTEWWLITEKDANKAWYRDLGNYDYSFEFYGSKNFGFCVRCMQD